MPRSIGDPGKLKPASNDLEARLGARPQLRIGLNSGPAIVGKVQRGAETVLGDTVNVAGRLSGRGLRVVAAETWGVARSESTFASLDVKAIRAEMGPEWCARREKPLTRVFYNFAPVEAR